MADFYFSLPPFEQLTKAQQAAIAETEPIALSGGPGTGKSVVSLWRHIINFTKDTPVKSQLLTYTTTLAFYLKACSESKSKEAARHVASSLKWTNKPVHCHEIIIDEAQDMPVDFNKSLLKFSKVISYGADNQQIIKVGAEVDGNYNLKVCSPEEELRKIFAGNALHRLDRNFRSTQRVMQFAKELFRDAYIPDEIIRGLKGRIGDLPRLLISKGNVEKQNNAVISLIKQFSNEATNIAVLVPFAKPPYGGSTYTTDYFYNLISKAGIDCSSYNYTNETIKEIKNVHITTFKSVKGLEFDVIIIPNFHLINQDFEVLTWKDFYVGITRTKNNLFLISASDIEISHTLIEKVTL